jgi:hypothetical protein
MFESNPYSKYSSKKYRGIALVQLGDGYVPKLAIQFNYFVYSVVNKNT